MARSNQHWCRDVRVDLAVLRPSDYFAGMAEPERASIAAHSRVVAGRGQLSANLAGEAVILGLNDGIYYGLDGSGARIWQLLQQPGTLESVADTISLEFEVDRDRALRDLIDLARDLLQRGLLDIVPDAAP